MEKEHPLQGQEQEKRQEQVKESVDKGEDGKCGWNMGAGAAGAAGVTQIETEREEIWRAGAEIQKDQIYIN